MCIVTVPRPTETPKGHQIDAEETHFIDSYRNGVGIPKDFLSACSGYDDGADPNDVSTSAALRNGEIPDWIVERFRLVPPNSELQTEFQLAIEPYLRKLFPDHDFEKHPIRVLLSATKDPLICCLNGTPSPTFIISSGILNNSEGPNAARAFLTLSECYMAIIHEAAHTWMKSKGITHSGAGVEAACDKAATEHACRLRDETDNDTLLFDPRGIGSYFRRCRELQGNVSVVAAITSTHPLDANRASLNDATVAINAENLTIPPDVPLTEETFPPASVSRKALHTSRLARDLDRIEYSAKTVQEKSEILATLICNLTASTCTSVYLFDVACEIGELRRQATTEEKEKIERPLGDVILFPRSGLSEYQRTVLYQHSFQNDGKPTAAGIVADLASGTADLTRAETPDQVLRSAKTILEITELLPILNTARFTKYLEPILKTFKFPFKDGDVVEWNQIVKCVDEMAPEDARTVARALLLLNVADHRVFRFLTVDDKAEWFLRSVQGLGGFSLLVGDYQIEKLPNRAINPVCVSKMTFSQEGRKQPTTLLGQSAFSPSVAEHLDKEVFAAASAVVNSMSHDKQTHEILLMRLHRLESEGRLHGKQLTESAASLEEQFLRDTKRFREMHGERVYSDPALQTKLVDTIKEALQGGNVLLVKAAVTEFFDLNKLSMSGLASAPSYIMRGDSHPLIDWVVRESHSILELDKVTGLLFRVISEGVRGEIARSRYRAEFLREALKYELPEVHDLKDAAQSVLKFAAFMRDEHPENSIRKFFEPIGQSLKRNALSPFMMIDMVAQELFKTVSNMKDCHKASTLRDLADIYRLFGSLNLVANLFHHPKLIVGFIAGDRWSVPTDEILNSQPNPSDRAVAWCALRTMDHLKGVQQHRSLTKILNDLGEPSDGTEVQVYREILKLGVDDIKDLETVVARYARSITLRLGTDLPGESKVPELADAVIAEIENLKKCPPQVKFLVAERFANAVQAQRTLTERLDEFWRGTTATTVKNADILMPGWSGLTTFLEKHPDLRKEVFVFLKSDGNADHAEALFSKLKNAGFDEISPQGVLNPVDHLQLLHRNFRAAPTLSRIAATRELVLPVGLDGEAQRDQAIREALTHAANFQSPLLQEGIRRYVASHYDHEQFFLISALLMPHSQNASDVQQIRNIAELLGKRGPAEAKSLQACASSTAVSNDVQQALSSAKYENNIPLRLAVHKMIDNPAVVPPAVRASIASLGRIRGGGAFRIAVEVYLHDGTKRILVMLRDDVERAAVKGFKRISELQAGLESDGHNVGGFRSVILEGSKRASNSLSMNVWIRQIERAQLLYDGAKVAAPDGLITFSAVGIVYPDGVKKATYGLGRSLILEEAEGELFAKLEPDSSDRKLAGFGTFVLQADTFLKQLGNDDDPHDGNAFVKKTPEGVHVTFIDYEGIPVEGVQEKDTQDITSTIYELAPKIKAEGVEKLPTVLMNHIRERERAGESVGPEVSRQVPAFNHLAVYRRAAGESVHEAIGPLLARADPRIRDAILGMSPFPIVPDSSSGDLKVSWLVRAKLEIAGVFSKTARRARDFVRSLARPTVTISRQATKGS